LAKTFINFGYFRKVMSTTNNIEINETFSLALKFVTETNENIFLTGKAGTGKTTFLKYLKEHCKKNMLVAAPTGVAAINAGGITLHSLFQLPFTPFLPTAAYRAQFTQNIRIVANNMRIIQALDLLIIDEISMVRADVLDAIDTTLRHVRRRYNQPFGGVQLLCIGDLYQLEPVAPQQEWQILSEYYNSKYFFDSAVMREVQPLLIELNKIYRQTDNSFVRLLNKVRDNQMLPEDFEDLNQRYQPGFSAYTNDGFITLTTHNRQADATNQKELYKLSTGEFSYKATITGNFAENAYPAEETLLLKEGAQVMFLKNNVAKNYYNGKIGIVHSLSTDEVIVQCGTEKIIVTPEIWENVKYTTTAGTSKIEQEVVGGFEQYPLRLAWAITVHKSQGLTFDKVMIDAAEAFTAGQVYVALSRCRSLEGIVLLSPINAAAIINNETIKVGSKQMEFKGSLQERFNAARIIFTQLLLEGIFDFNRIANTANLLQQKVAEVANNLNPDAIITTQNICNNISNIKKVADLFVTKFLDYLKQNGTIETNEALQQKLIAAHQYFAPLLNNALISIKNHGIITEHKMAADAVDPALTNLYNYLHQQNYLISYCSNNFTLASFLQHKINYKQVTFKLSVFAAGSAAAPVGSVPNIELYTQLKNWRNAIVLNTGLPTFRVANQESIQEIATYLPLTNTDLQQIKGFGKAKADAYGPEIIDLVYDYCTRYNLQTQMHLLSTSGKKIARATTEQKNKTTKPPTTPTRQITYQMFVAGKSIAAIATERNFAQSTIAGHLAEFVKTGELPLHQLVTPEITQQITEAINTATDKNTTAIKANLPAQITYNQIRFVLAAQECQANKI
jgi:hypothetical protein